MDSPRNEQEDQTQHMAYTELTYRLKRQKHVGFNEWFYGVMAQPRVGPPRRVSAGRRPMIHIPIAFFKQKNNLKRFRCRLFVAMLGYVFT